MVGDDPALLRRARRRSRRGSRRRALPAAVVGSRLPACGPHWRRRPPSGRGRCWRRSAAQATSCQQCGSGTAAAPSASAASHQRLHAGARYDMAALEGSCFDQTRQPGFRSPGRSRPEASLQRRPAHRGLGADNCACRRWADERTHRRASATNRGDHVVQDGEGRDDGNRAGERRTTASTTRRPARRARPAGPRAASPSSLSFAPYPSIANPPHPCRGQKCYKTLWSDAKTGPE